MKAWMIILKIAALFLIWTASAFAGNWLAKRHSYKRYEKARAAWEDILKADYVRVIRCKDCEHFAEYTDEYKRENGCDGCCINPAWVSEHNNTDRFFFDHCSRAEAFGTGVDEDE